MILPALFKTLLLLFLKNFIVIYDAFLALNCHPLHLKLYLFRLVHYYSFMNVMMMSVSGADTINFTARVINFIVVIIKAIQILFHVGYRTN